MNPPAAPTGARPVLIYTVARVALLGAVLLVLRLVGLRGPLLLVLGVLGSGVISYVLLAPQRVAMARTVEGRLAGRTAGSGRLRRRMGAAREEEDAYVDRLEADRRTDPPA